MKPTKPSKPSWPPILHLRRSGGQVAYQIVKTFGTRQLSSISLEELKAWIDDPTLGARSRIHNATKISQLFNYSIRQGWAAANLVERITRPCLEDKAVEVFTPTEASQLLAHAEPLGLLPFIAIGLFAGLRTAEIQRLDWSAVRLSEKCIIIGAEVAKRRSRRVVEIDDSLAAWLALCAKPSGAIAGFREDQLAFRIRQPTRDAGLSKWRHNGLRHSFASYHLALHGDPTKTAFQMGNSAIMVHNHYKGLVSHGDVQRYWSLRPDADAAEKIVAMKAANG